MGEMLEDFKSCHPCSRNLGLQTSLHLGLQRVVNGLLGRRSPVRPHFWVGACVYFQQRGVYFGPIKHRNTICLMMQWNCFVVQMLVAGCKEDTMKQSTKRSCGMRD